jgi:hypothetical protein
MSNIRGTVPAKREPRENAGERFMVPADLYYVELVEVDEADNAGRNPDWGNSWKWKFIVSDQQGKVVTSSTMGPNGRPQPLPMIQFTSDKMGVSPAGVKARGRQWFEALLRRELRDNEDLGEIAEAATGEIARALISHQTSKTTGTEFCAIAQMLPADEDTVEKFRERKRQLASATDEVPF